MKKNYSKPEILFEDFSVSCNIAAGCEAETNHELYSCGYYVQSMRANVFMSTVGACKYTEVNSTVTIDATGEASFNGICYHVPSDTNNVFTS